MLYAVDHVLYEIVKHGRLQALGSLAGPTDRPAPCSGSSRRRTATRATRMAGMAEACTSVRGLRSDAKSIATDFEYACGMLQAAAARARWFMRPAYWSMLACRARRRGGAVAVGRACRAYPALGHLFEVDAALGGVSFALRHVRGLVGSGCEAGIAHVCRLWRSSRGRCGHAEVQERGGRCVAPPVGPPVGPPKHQDRFLAHIPPEQVHDRGFPDDFVDRILVGRRDSAPGSDRQHSAVAHLLDMEAISQASRIAF